MSRNVIVRYKTHPEAADENARLVGEVFRALAESDPGDLEYTTYRLTDGVTFVHVAQELGDVNPLTALPEFAEFQRELPARCEVPPDFSEASVVGSYRSSARAASVRSD